MVRTSLGCHFVGAANPHPDHTDKNSCLEGVKYRFCRQPPKPDLELMNEFGQFVDKWLRENLIPLDADSDCSVETWLNNTNYPKWRKEQLQNCYDRTNGILDPEDLKVKSFIKDETYPSYKYPRAINSRTDSFKIRVGPIFKLIENVVYKLHWFIKHVPVDERCDVIKRDCYQDGAKIIGTDYTAYEAIFIKLMMMSCEMKLYKYMTQNLPDQDWYHIVESTLTGRNKCIFKMFTCYVDATRMSGEMCTSLGNGFTNLMVFLFTAHKLNLKSLKGKVEGDDGIFTFYGEVPSTDWFAKLGLIIKIVEYEELSLGSFCGILCDSDDMINVTNPIDALLDFGWTSGKYSGASDKKLRMLLRAKSMSLAYQYPGCPILDALSKYGLRVTKGEKFLLNLDPYKTELFRTMFLKYGTEFPIKTPSLRTRLLVERLFKIPINQQLKFENYLDHKQDLSPIEFGDFLDLVNADQKHYYDNYLVDDRVDPLKL